ncbi:MAG: methionine--tRNA ligase [Bacteroidota bacterium]|nr:methionine--tRNA ligase [Bacteroidota bacterium]
MSGKNKRFTVTAALPYANGPIHIGHLAGVYIPADIFSRYQRLINNDVAFICGSDEHGVAISLQARKESITPKELIDRYDKLIRDSFEKFGISFDNYSRTSREIHHKNSIELFNLLNEKDLFSFKTTKQYYDKEAKQFLADRYIIGICPICDAADAYGDQCENCGSTLSTDELKNPKSTISNSKPILKDTKHWYINLNEFEDFITDWITKEHKDDWKPNVTGQVKSWLDNGLKPRAVTRDLDWGIPINVEGEEGKVLYVWFEAPIGYISSTKEWAEKNKKDWSKYWKDENTKLVHFIGKDNIVFHCIIFPIILKMLGDYILPFNVPANEFLNLEGNKISTSKNWAVWLHEYLEDFPNMQDVLRYVLTVNAPETKDNDFTWKEFQMRNNSELVAIYGNFVNRVLTLIIKYYNGIVPNPDSLDNSNKKIIEQVKGFPKSIGKSLDEFKFREAIKSLMNLARIGNKYLADSEPWKLQKSNPEKVKEILYVGYIIICYLSILSEPFLPNTAKKLKSQLNLGEIKNWNDLDYLNNKIDFSSNIESKEVLFRKIEDDEIIRQVEKLKKMSNQ